VDLDTLKIGLQRRLLVGCAVRFGEDWRDFRSVLIEFRAFRLEIDCSFRDRFVGGIRRAEQLVRVVSFVFNVL